MINLLKSLFFRLKYSKMFWILFGVAAAMPLLEMLLLLGLGSSLETLESTSGVGAMDAMRSQNLAAMELSGLCSVMPTHSLLAVICTSIFLSRDFSNGTFRNVLVANHSRLQLYFAHLTVALTVGTCFLGATLVSDLVFMGSVFGFAEMTATQIVVAVFISLGMGLASCAFAQTLMCMLLFASRKLAVALACTIVICLALPSLIATIVAFVETLDIMLNRPENIANLSWVPLVNAEMMDVANPDGALVGKILLYILPLTALFVTLGWTGFRKANLK